MVLSRVSRHVRGQMVQGTTWFEAETVEDRARSRAVAGVACPVARHMHAPRQRLQARMHVGHAHASASRALKPRSLHHSIPTSSAYLFSGHVLLRGGARAAPSMFVHRPTTAVCTREVPLSTSLRHRAHCDTRVGARSVVYCGNGPWPSHPPITQPSEAKKKLAVVRDITGPHSFLCYVTSLGVSPRGRRIEPALGASVVYHPDTVTVGRLAVW